MTWWWSKGRPWFFITDTFQRAATAALASGRPARPYARNNRMRVRAPPFPAPSSLDWANPGPAVADSQTAGCKWKTSDRAGEAESHTHSRPASRKHLTRATKLATAAGHVVTQLCVQM